MQTLHDEDASNWFKSLDDIYYFGGQNAHEQVVIYPHSPGDEEEIKLEVGDVIKIAGNHWNGYSKGRNQDTKKEGLYSSFKVKDKLVKPEFPAH